jgi:perosamine synthetase
MEASQMAEFVPLCVPEIRGNEWKYIKDCLDTNWVSSVGPYVERLEREVAHSAGTKFAVAAVNGTAALHIALLVAGVEPNDEVLVSTLTFIAPVNAIRYAGAWPSFIDSEPAFWQMDPEKVRDFLERDCVSKGGRLYNAHSGRRVTAIIPVHILGHPVDMDPILLLARRYGLKVIEDATEGLGSEYRGRKVGSLGDIACFSFNGNKIVTTGGGGMMVTDNEELARRAKYLTTQAKDDEIEYIHNEIGYNYRLVNVLAAMGVAQMEMLPEYVRLKREIASRYQQGLKDLSGITPMREAPWASSTFWMYTVLVDEDRFGMTSRDLMRRLAEKKIQTRPLWQPIHRSPAHILADTSKYPVAEKLYQRGLSLPCSVGLAAGSEEKVIESIGEVASHV